MYYDSNVKPIPLAAPFVLVWAPLVVWLGALAAGPFALRWCVAAGG